jgi:hypothetical protein
MKNQEANWWTGMSTLREFFGGATFLSHGETAFALTQIAGNHWMTGKGQNV